MFEKVLYPTDFSNCSETVIPYLKDLKKSGTKEVVILHVLDDRHESLIKSVVWLRQSDQKKLDEEFIESVKKESEKKVKSLEDELGKDFKVKVVIEKGVPFKTITDVADRENVSAIVLCSHGMSDLEEMLLGSVAEKVIRKSKQPCIVIKRCSA